MRRMKGFPFAIVKRAVLIAALGLFVLYSSGVAYAGTITITDLTEGAPVLSVPSDVEVTGDNVTAEGRVLDGIFHIPNGSGVICEIGDASCDQGFNLMENDGSLSDTVHLIVHGPGQQGPVDWQEPFTLIFASDPLGTPLPGQVLTENRFLQHLQIDQGHLFVETQFNVNVQSDIDAAPAVPEPASLLLLGTGLIGGLRRWRKQRLNG